MRINRICLQIRIFILFQIISLYAKLKINFVLWIVLPPSHPPRMRHQIKRSETKQRIYFDTCNVSEVSLSASEKLLFVFKIAQSRVDNINCRKRDQTQKIYFLTSLNSTQALKK